MFGSCFFFLPSTLISTSQLSTSNAAEVAIDTPFGFGWSHPGPRQPWTTAKASKATQATGRYWGSDAVLELRHARTALTSEPMAIIIGLNNFNGLDSHT